ncbi:hypothetical protein [Desulfobacula sp.]|uniref:hypothetical protein n=1 Tax=Desulfobacula sp. TaxID=2593537 RepID=UPI00262953B3|nr:hypothetical protein [Desulfobacula sp.]
MTKLNKKNQSPITRSCSNSKRVRTTTSHPAKINLKVDYSVKVLASNVDTLVITLDTIMENAPTFFSILAEAKALARLNKKDVPVSFKLDKINNEYIFDVKATGANGREWIIWNKEYSLAIANSTTTQAMPNIIVTIRSETLWRKGLYNAIQFILNFLHQVGAKIQKARISRLDLCVDALFSDSLWSTKILDYAVRRATTDDVRLDNVCIHRSHKKLTGIDIGKNKMKVRFYDKVLEIIQKSNKTWLFDIWNLSEVPKGFKVIRTEFQLRREILKEIGIDSIDDLFSFIDNAWAYCTVKWLKFQSHPEKQSHQRKTLPWWEKIQNGFNNCPVGNPLIRAKAANADKTRLSQQILGLMSSFAALELETGCEIAPEDINLLNTFESFRNHLYINNLVDIEFSKRVEKKKAKFQRINNKYVESLEKRKELGLLPDNAA